MVGDTNDNDYLRVSSNQFDGATLNYHSITPARAGAPSAKQVARASEDVANHIGKPLVALPVQHTPTIQPSLQSKDTVQATAVVPKAAVHHNNNIQGQQRAPSSLPPNSPLLVWNTDADSGGLAEQQLAVTKRQGSLGASAQVQAQQQQRQQRPAATRQPKPKATTTSASPGNSKRHVHMSYPHQQSLSSAAPRGPVGVTAGTSTAQPPSANTCKWMQLNEFKNVSFETGRMVFVDDSDQPCYILTMRAFVRWNDTLYFPLRNYRPHPRGSYKVSLKWPTDGAIRPLVLNCSMPAELRPAASASIALLPNQLAADHSFDEEITFLVECGYLTLKLTGDDAHIALNSISFHQNPNLTDERPRDKRRRYQDSMIGNAKGVLSSATGPADGVQLSALTVPESGPAGLAKEDSTMVLNRHQVFSSEAVHKAPLLIMPLISRYSCQNRIVLNGSNLVQIVLERFELQRLMTNPPTGSSSAQPSITTGAYRQRTNTRASSLRVTEGNYMFNTGEDDNFNNALSPDRDFGLTPQEKVHKARLIAGQRTRRSPGDTTILYKRPLLAGK